MPVRIREIFHATRVYLTPKVTSSKCRNDVRL